MRVNVIIPVFNRLEHTRKVLDALRRQTLADALTIVVVNDGFEPMERREYRAVCRCDVCRNREASGNHLVWGVPSEEGR